MKELLVGRVAACRGVLARRSSPKETRRMGSWSGVKRGSRAGSAKAVLIERAKVRAGVQGTRSRSYGSN